MKNTVKEFKAMRSIAIIALAAIIAFSMAACSGSGGGKTLNSTEALKEYLDKQPVNGPDKPIRISMTINDPMFESVAQVIESAGKYVSLNITGNALTTITDAFSGCETLTDITIPNSVTSIKSFAFYKCTSLTGIIIPNSVTEIGDSAFAKCTNLTSVTFQGTIDRYKMRGVDYGYLEDYDYPSFYGDLYNKYLAGGIGAYTTTAPVVRNSTWTKK